MTTKLTGTKTVCREVLVQLAVGGRPEWYVLEVTELGLAYRQKGRRHRHELSHAAAIWTAARRQAQEPS